MTIFNNCLFTDLHNRLEKMITHLTPLTPTSAVASRFKKVAVTTLGLLKAKVKKIMESGELNQDFFAPNVIIKYNSLNNEFMEIELFLFHPISRYNDNAEGYFEKVVTSIYYEIGTTLPVPFISTFSNSDAYYWAYSKYDMIALPQGEEKHLLHLSDLYHEIGHLIFVKYEEFLIVEHLSYIENYYEIQLQTKKGRKNKEFRELLKSAKEKWASSWSEELSCDLIATFLVGAAYAWTNMKASAISSGINEIYSHNKVFRVHPPDEIRMRAILAMLKKTGLHEEAAKVQAEWEQFLSIARNDKPKNYDLIFPPEMIESIVENVFEACGDMTLQPYSQQLLDNTLPVSLIINQAWNKIRDDPANFPRWEDEQIENLQSRTA